MFQSTWFFCAITLMIQAALCQTTVPVRLEDRVAELAGPYIDGKIVRGMAIGVVTRDLGPRVFGFGHTSGQADSPAPDGRTIFEIASVTKTFTALLLADMAQKKELALEDLLSRHLPAGTAMPPTDQPITLLRLATHHSGLPRMPSNFAPRDPRNPYADYTTPKLYAFLGQCTPHETAKFEYSNYGFALLGQAMANRAGRSYEALVIERIATPLGMKDTKIELTDADRKRLAAPFAADGKPAHPWDLGAFAGGGAIRSTADDMLRYLQAQLGMPIPGLADQAPLLRAIEDTQRPRDQAGNQTRICLAWLLTPNGQHWHNGQTGGYHSYVAFDRANQAGVVILCNTASMKVDELGTKVLKAVLDRATK